MNEYTFSISGLCFSIIYTNIILIRNCYLSVRLSKAEISPRLSQSRKIAARTEAFKRSMALLGYSEGIPEALQYRFNPLLFDESK